MLSLIYRYINYNDVLMYILQEAPWSNISSVIDSNDSYYDNPVTSSIEVENPLANANEENVRHKRYNSSKVEN